jgi:hypothetical protein
VRGTHCRKTALLDNVMTVEAGKRHSDVLRRPLRKKCLLFIYVETTIDTAAPKEMPPIYLRGNYNRYKVVCIGRRTTLATFLCLRNLTFVPNYLNSCVNIV